MLCTIVHSKDPVRDRWLLFILIITQALFWLLVKSLSTLGLVPYYLPF